MSKYRFRLKIGSAAYVLVHPRWSGDDSSIVTEQGENEMYYRSSLNAKLTFQRSDFDLIHAAPLETGYLILLQEFNGSSWVSISLAKFFKTDFELVDLDNKTIVVTPKTFDNYEKVLAGMGKEYDLISLAPPTVDVNFSIQPIFQVIALTPSGSATMNNFLGGVFFETTLIDTPTPGNLTSDYHFGFIGSFGVMMGVGEGLSPDVAGEYVDEDNNPADRKWRRKDGLYRIQNEAVGPDTRAIIKRVSDNVTVYTGTLNAGFDTAVFTSTTSSDTTVFRNVAVYARLLLRKDTIAGHPATVEDIPEPDIVSDHGNYTKVVAIGNTDPAAYGTPWQDVITVLDGHSTTPDRWGKFSPTSFLFGGEYFTSPSGSNLDSIYPISRSEWTQAAVWWNYDDVLREFQETAALPVTVVGYKLSDVINSLLSEIGATVGHLDNSGFSNFLYAATNAIRGSRKVPVITPKSNVLVGQYDQPAQKAPIRLREVMDLVRDFYNAYWHLSAEGFIIEHRHYYDNGKSYTSPGVGIDLTTSLEPRTGKPWSYRTSNYKYDKTTLPERIESKWMDDVSQSFEGYPIQVKSVYANIGDVKQNRISRFTSDIDFFNVAASKISTDGFVLFECVEDGTDLNVPFVEIIVSADERYKLQNGYASFLYAHETYWKHGLPAESVNLNRVDITATTTIRAITQELEIAVGSTIDPYLLITSKLGDAKIKKIEKNLSSKSLRIELKHDTQ